MLKRITDSDKHNGVWGDVGNLNKATVQNYPVLLASSKNC